MRKRWVTATIGLALILAACGGESGDSETEDTTTTTVEEVEATTTTAAPDPTTTQAPDSTTTTSEAPAGPEGMIPDPSTANGVTLVPSSDENILAGDVFLYWYREAGGGNYLGIYTGPGIAGSAGQMLCPGNSIQTANGFENISNTPAEDGACQDFPTAQSEMMVCSGDVWISRTAIPGDVEGVLWGSLEWNAADGTIKGMTSQLTAIPDFPEFEYGLASYSLWDGFTSDGSSVIECADPNA